MGKEILKGREATLDLDFRSYERFKKGILECWDVNRITIIASPNKAIVVPCLPYEDTELGKHRLAILITDSTVFKL